MFAARIFADRVPTKILPYKMNSLKERLVRLESIVGEDNIKEQIDQFDEKLRTVMETIPEFSKLDAVRLPPSVDKKKAEFNIKLLLSNINEYRSLIDNLTYINSADIDRYHFQDVDLSIILDNKEKIISLTNRYMRCLVKSLLVLQKYIDFVTAQNDLTLSKQDQIRMIKRKKAIEESSRY